MAATPTTDGKMSNAYQDWAPRVERRQEDMYAALESDDEDLNGLYTTWPPISKGRKAKRPIHQATQSAADSSSDSRVTSAEDASWSDEFHRLLVALSSRKNLSDLEEERLFENLRRLELDFVYTAETWGRVIIEELFLPDEKKTIKPLSGRGTLGGYKYEVRGVFFKFAHEIEYLVSSSNAAKVSAHELRACGAVALYALESSDCSLLPPLMAMVDFRGYRLLAVSQLPIRGDETLVYGSHDAGRSVKNTDERFHNAMKTMARHFNLAEHFSGVDDSTVLYTGADIEGHYDSARDRYYIVDLARMFPPEAPSGIDSDVEATFVNHPQCEKNSCPCWVWRERAERLLTTGSSSGATALTGKPSEAELRVESGGTKVKDPDEMLVVDNPRLYRQLRPFFVQQKDVPSLSSDAFSKFQSFKDAEENNRRVLEQSTRLRTVCVQRACVFLQHREADSALFPRHFSFSQFLHERGMNVRLLGLVFLRLSSSSEATAWRLNCLMEMVARSFKTLLRRRFRAVARMKGFILNHEAVVDLSAVSKARGERNVGDDDTAGSSESSVSTATTFRASDEDFHDEAVRLLSMLVMHIEPLGISRSFSKEQEHERWRTDLFVFWDRLIRIMKSKFGLVACTAVPSGEDTSASPMEDVLCPVKLPELLRPHIAKVFERACQCVGFQMTLAPRVFSTPVSPDFPLSMDALAELKPQVRHLNLIRLAEAKVMHKRALRERNQRACEMLRKARYHLEQILKESPPTKSFFLLATLGEILYALAIRIQPERIEFELADEALRNLMKAEGAFREIAARTMVMDGQVVNVSNVSNVLKVIRDEEEEEMDGVRAQAAIDDATTEGKHVSRRIVLGSMLSISKPSATKTKRKSVKINEGERDGLNPAFLSKASSHPLVMKTQHAKRYANVVSSVAIKDLNQTRFLVPFGSGTDRLVFVGGAGEAKVWSLRKKQLVQTIPSLRDVRSVAVMSSEGDEEGLIIGCRRLSSGDHIQSFELVHLTRNSLAHPTPITVYSSVASASDDGNQILPAWQYSLGTWKSAGEWCLSTLDRDRTSLIVLQLSWSGAGSLLLSKKAPSSVSATVPSLVVERTQRIVKLVDEDSDKGVEEITFAVHSTSKELMTMACRTSDDVVKLIVVTDQLNFNVRVCVVAKQQLSSGERFTSIALSDEDNVGQQKLAMGTSNGRIDVYSIKHLIEENPSKVRLEGHLDGILSVRFAGHRWPNQDTLFSASTDRTIRIWNVSLGVCLRVLSGHLDSVTTLSYSENQKLLVSASHDASIRTWRFDHVPFLPVASPDSPSPIEVLNEALRYEKAPTMDGAEREESKEAERGRRRRWWTRWFRGKTKIGECFGFVHHHQGGVEST